MNRGFDIPKASTESAARGIFDGLENGEEDISPIPCLSLLRGAGAMAWPRRMRSKFAAFVPRSAASL